MRFFYENLEAKKQEKIKNFKQKQQEAYKTNDLSELDRKAFKRKQEKLLIRFQKEQEKLLDAQIMELILVTLFIIFSNGEQTFH